MKRNNLFILILFMLMHVTVASVAQPANCRASLKNDTLVIENEKIQQKWIWNEGNLIPYSLKNAACEKPVLLKCPHPFFQIEGASFIANKRVEINPVEETILSPAHLELVVENEYQSLDAKFVLRIFPETAAVSFDYYLKYQSLFHQSEQVAIQTDGTEGGLQSLPENGKSWLLRAGFDSKHWDVKVVEFKDATDAHDNLVFERSIIPYRAAERMGGNLLFATDLVSGNRFFVLKEAPNTASQINFPGFDFSIDQSGIQMPFSGFPTKSNVDEWVKGYSVTMGAESSSGDLKLTLREYLKRSLNYSPEDYEMVMMNTWGDRGKDGRISEKFILSELERAAQLGISHFQVDDGWQQGLSSNSVSKSGNLWDAWIPENWEPNKDRFPNGLGKVIESANAKHIQLGLWFHPTNEHSYATWETDADIIINLYTKTGIRYFKIDGVEIKDKQAEINLGKFFEKVKAETNGQVFFNLDLTAGIRGGYFSYRPFGNLFVENRYTDWGNYYPFHTLRNLWMLSAYFPPERLQIEFLNSWRNLDKYPKDDPFVPGNYRFEYLFAITMAAQPLAWFEATGLPDEGMAIGETIKKYRAIQSDFHKGTILPIGDEPNGRSWTGFQSIEYGRGYFLIFREASEASKAQIEIMLKPGAEVLLKPLLGDKTQNENLQTVNVNGTLSFDLPEANSFVLFQYEIK